MHHPQPHPVTQHVDPYHVDHYRLSCPLSKLAIRLVDLAEPGQPERIVGRLAPADQCTRFTTAQAANNAWALYLGPQHLELERVIG